MESEEIMKLFDSCWFEMEIFNKRTSPSQSPSSEPNPDLEKEEIIFKPAGGFTRSTTLHTRSMSDQLSLSRSFLDSVSLSPDSVLHTPKLHKIISGKEMTEEDMQDNINYIVEEEEEEEEKKNKEIISKVILKRKKKGMSKSLSDLEFEELKGFMDLGFVFSEEDNKDSRLVEIIPALQRLGKKQQDLHHQPAAGGEDNNNNNKTSSTSTSTDDDKEKAELVVSRPYLSEAWQVSERRRRKEKENPLMNWKVPALGNEIDMKDSLRWWAHTVASTVR